MIKLHGFHRSSASHRVRIGLNLKKIPYSKVEHDLSSGAHRDATYLAINPQGLLPSLETGSSVITQSLAILEYLDAQYPDPSIFPSDQFGRAKVRAMFQIIAADTHPVNSMRVVKYLKETFRQDDNAVRVWQHHWLAESLSALEIILAQSEETGPYCYGGRPTIADLALIPQVTVARRVGFSTVRYKCIDRIVDHCMCHPAFIAAQES